MRKLGSSAMVGALVAVALAGCGGGESPQGTAPAPEATTATTTPAAPGATATTVPAAAADDDELGAPLLAWADSDTDEGKAPLTIQFKADIEGGKAPLSYVWKFGDGSPDSTEANPKHTYEKPGKYRADLEVKDSAGDSDSDYIEVEVTE